jgi:hypothetical protein
MIWRPSGDNKYGHAAVQTDKYHMSFWPDGAIKSDLSAFQAMTSGVVAAINFHHNLDKYLEDRRDPVQYRIVNVSDSALNRIYEKFLAYNNINPSEVTLAKGILVLSFSKV